MNKKKPAMNTLLKIASLHLKMDAWRSTIRLPLGWVKHPIFQVQTCWLVSGSRYGRRRFSVAMWTNMCGTSLEAQEGNNHMLLSLNFWQRNLFNQRFMNFPQNLRRLHSRKPASLHPWVRGDSELGVPHHEASVPAVSFRGRFEESPIFERHTIRHF